MVSEVPVLVTGHGWHPFTGGLGDLALTLRSCGVGEQLSRCPRG